MKIVILEHCFKTGFSDKFVACENIKAASDFSGIGESTLKKYLYGKLKMYDNKIWKVRWLELHGATRKERSDKAKRVEQMKKINVARFAEKVKEYGGEIKLEGINRTKFNDEIMKDKKIEDIQAIETPAQQNRFYSPKPERRFDYWDKRIAECDEYDTDEQEEIMNGVKSETEISEKQRGLLLRGGTRRKQ